MASKCFTCNKEKPTPTESLIPSSFPSSPWERQGMDLVELKGTSYLVDYCSRWLEVKREVKMEVKKLNSQSSESEVDLCLSRHTWDSDIRQRISIQLRDFPNLCEKIWRSTCNELTKIHTRYTQDTHTIHTRYTQDTHKIHTRYTQDTHKIHTR